MHRDCQYREITESKLLKVHRRTDLTFNLVPIDPLVVLVCFP
jgi:hypothetical protein